MMRDKVGSQMLDHGCLRKKQLCLTSALLCNIFYCYFKLFSHNFMLKKCSDFFFIFGG